MVGVGDATIVGTIVAERGTVAGRIVIGEFTREGGVVGLEEEGTGVGTFSRLTGAHAHAPNKGGRSGH